MLEATLQLAQRSYEERKLRVIAKLLATISFDPSISPATAHTLIKLVEGLTYRQLVLLSLLGQNARGANPFGLRDELYGPGRTTETPAIGHELYELYQRELTWRHDPDSEVGTTVFGANDLAPSRMELEGLGQILFRTADLSSSIPYYDVMAMARELRTP